jgi:hypothetical protein
MEEDHAFQRMLSVLQTRYCTCGPEFSVILILLTRSPLPVSPYPRYMISARPYSRTEEQTVELVAFLRQQKGFFTHIASFLEEICSQIGMFKPPEAAP